MNTGQSGVEVIQSDRDQAAAHCLPRNRASNMRAGLMDGDSLVQAFARYRQSLTAREPATADVGREDAELLADANAWYSQVQLDEISQTVEDAFREGFNEGADNQQRGYGYSQTPSHYATADKKTAWEDSDAKKALAALQARPS